MRQIIKMMMMIWVNCYSVGKSAWGLGMEYRILPPLARGCWVSVLDDQNIMCVHCV